MPVTTTVWAIFQLELLKVKLVLTILPSVNLELVKGRVTVAVGALPNLTVKLAVPPLSVVLPLIAETISPAVSSSVTVTVTSAGFRLL